MGTTNVLFVFCFILIIITENTTGRAHRKKAKALNIKGNTKIDKIIINNFLGYSTNLVQTMLRVNDLIFISDNRSIFTPESLRKSGSLLADAEAGCDQMKKNMQSMKIDIKRMKLNDMTSLTNDMTLLRIDMTSLKTDIRKNLNDIALTNDMKTLKNDMTSFKQEMRSLKNDMASLKNDIKNDMASLISGIMSLKILVNEIPSKNYQIDINSLKNDTTSLMGDMKTLKTLVNDFPSRNDSLKNDITFLKDVCRDFSDFNATFTTLGATGRIGPKSLGNHYVGKSHNGMVTLTNGIQLFTIPCTGIYRITVAGAASGYGVRDPKATRGRGAMLSGSFTLTKGMVLKVLVGQTGGYIDKDYAVGGGGGTFVTDISNNARIIAGGGGGTQYYIKSRHWQCDGTTNMTGNPNYQGTIFQGGKNSHGAKEGDNCAGGGGGGLLSDGRQGGCFGYSTGNAKSFISGGIGGTGSYYAQATGGFGGGGGAGIGGGGGGGGYSGGASGANAVNSCAGGGGSYNSGTDKQGLNGANNSEGYVVMTRIN